MNFLERGEKPKDHQNTSNSRIASHKGSLDSSAIESPNLIIDVNMGDKIEQIMIYKGDEYRIPELAKNFAIKHNLDYNSQLKLIDLLKVEIENVLDRID